MGGSWSKGIDPMTPAGNIEAGVLFLSDYLTAYGDPELAVMAYNCGPSGAQNLWAAGTYSTDHSRKVMDRFDYWTSVFGGLSHALLLDLPLLRSQPGPRRKM